MREKICKLSFVLTIICLALAGWIGVLMVYITIKANCIIGTVVTLLCVLIYSISVHRRLDKLDEFYKK